MDTIEFDVVERHINQLKALMEEDLAFLRQCSGVGHSEQLHLCEGTLRSIKKAAKYYESLIIQLPEQHRKVFLERRLAGHMQDVERYAKELRRERGDSPHLPPDPAAWEALGALLASAASPDALITPSASLAQLQQQSTLEALQDKAQATVPRHLESLPSPEGSRADLLAGVQPARRKKKLLSLKRLFG